MVCCFFGHRDAPCDLSEHLYQVLDILIKEGADSFLMGHQGRFDTMVLQVLRSLKQAHPHISYHVVLAYWPSMDTESRSYYRTETIYPEGLEFIHPHYAIAWRNRWMLNESDVVVTYITHSWGGAAKYAELAQKKKKRVINIAMLMTDNKTLYK